MTDFHTEAPDALVEALLVHGGILRQVFDHMVATEAAGHSAPDAAPPSEVLCDLTAMVLLPHFEALPPEDVATALDVLMVAIAALQDEIFLVDPEADPRPRNRQERRRRRRGAC